MASYACNDFHAAGTSCLTNDGTGLWCKWCERVMNLALAAAQAAQPASLGATPPSDPVSVEELRQHVSARSACAHGWHDTQIRALLDRLTASPGAEVDAVYLERNRLVAALSKLFPASLERHPDTDVAWDDDWRWIVFIDLPTGQASWHLHDSHLALFDHLPRLDGRTWDGHTTDEKYARLTALQPPRRTG
jgi:hypothetical protein